MERTGSLLDCLLNNIFTTLLGEEGVYAIFQFSLICRRSYAFVRELKMKDCECKHGGCKCKIYPGSCDLSIIISSRILSDFQPNYKGYDCVDVVIPGLGGCSRIKYYPTRYYVLTNRLYPLETRLQIIFAYMRGIKTFALDRFMFYLLTQSLLYEEYDINKVANMIGKLMSRVYLACPLKCKIRLEGYGKISHRLSNMIELTHKAGSFDLLIDVIKENIPPMFWHSCCFLVKVAYLIDSENTAKQLNLNLNDEYIRQKESGYKPLNWPDDWKLEYKHDLSFVDFTPDRIPHNEVDYMVNVMRKYLTVKQARKEVNEIEELNKTWNIRMSRQNV